MVLANAKHMGYNSFFFIIQHFKIGKENHRIAFLGLIHEKTIYKNS